jgi:hypothetical protein
MFKLKMDCFVLEENQNTDIINIESRNDLLFDHIFGDIDIDECEKYDQENDKNACFVFSDNIYNKYVELSKQYGDENPILFKLIYNELCKPCKELFIKECEKWFIHHIDLSYEEYEKRKKITAYSQYHNNCYYDYIRSKIIDYYDLKIKFNINDKMGNKICDFDYTYKLYFDNDDSTIAVANFTLYDINIFYNGIKPFVNMLNAIFSLRSRSKYIAVIGDKYIGLARTPSEYYHFIKKTMTCARLSPLSCFYHDYLPFDLVKYIFWIMFEN